MSDLLTVRNCDNIGNKTYFCTVLEPWLQFRRLGQRGCHFIQTQVVSFLCILGFFGEENDKTQARSFVAWVWRCKRKFKCLCTAGEHLLYNFSFPLWVYYVCDWSLAKWSVDREISFQATVFKCVGATWLLPIYFNRLIICLWECINCLKM